MNKLKIAALLALAGTGIFTQNAQAFTAASGDIVIGFRSTNNGITKDYVIDIGQSLLGIAQANPGSTITIGTFGGDLSTFDSTWFTDGTTRWGVVGGTETGDGASTIYAGIAETAAQHPWLTSGAPSAYKGSPGNSTTVSKYNTVYNLITAGTATTGDTLSGDTSGAGFGLVGEQMQISTTANTWQQGVIQSGGAFARYALGNFDATVGTGGFSDNIDLFRLTTTNLQAGINEGTFAVSSNGTITFTTVPEPSALMALIGGAGFLGIIRRRRSATA